MKPADNNNNDIRHDRVVPQGNECPSFCLEYLHCQTVPTWGDLPMVATLATKHFSDRRLSSNNTKHLYCDIKIQRVIQKEMRWSCVTCWHKPRCIAPWTSHEKRPPRAPTTEQWTFEHGKTLLSCMLQFETMIFSQIDDTSEQGQSLLRPVVVEMRNPKRKLLQRVLIITDKQWLTENACGSTAPTTPIAEMFGTAIWPLGVPFCRQHVPEKHPITY